MFGKWSSSNWWRPVSPECPLYIHVLRHISPHCWIMISVPGCISTLISWERNEKLFILAIYQRVITRGPFPLRLFILLNDLLTETVNKTQRKNESRRLKRERKKTKTKLIVVSECIKCRGTCILTYIVKRSKYKSICVILLIECGGPLRWNGVILEYMFLFVRLYYGPMYTQTHTHISSDKSRLRRVSKKRGQQTIIMAIQ